MKVQDIQQVLLQAPLVNRRFGTVDTQKGVNHCFAVFFQHRLQQPDELVAVAFFADISDSFKGVQRLVDGTFFRMNLVPGMLRRSTRSSNPYLFVGFSPVKSRLSGSG